MADRKMIYLDDVIDAFDCSISGVPFHSVKYVSEYADKMISRISALPSAQPEHLTDEDFETIRIHLNAYKEQLCNQHRWEEAEEYQRIIDRFMAFASAQPEIIHCNSCKHWTQSTGKMKGYGLGRCDFHDADLVTCNGFCYWAERRNDE